MPGLHLYCCLYCAYKNGALLRRCVYLNMGSSYSIASEDGVEVSVLESCFSNDDEDCLNLEEHKKRNLQNAIDGPTNQMLNFTFEAQVQVQLDLNCAIPVDDFLFKFMCGAFM